MAQSAIRLRRSLPALRRSLLSAFPSLSPYPPLLNPCISSSSSSPTSSVVQSRLFRSSPAVSFLSSSSNKTYHLYKEGDEITPDTILFEGCDYNHWLIVMEFPKDPKPTPEEMVRTYEETCARGLNISLEEAKQKMYACSTTTYQGFQAVMTEEESKKFEGLPGVVFVLPDSYIDPQNKEYGGDKYINGTIIPRPPPIQYSTGGRSRDRSRNFDRRGPRGPMQNQQAGPMQNQQMQRGNMQYNSQGPMQGDGGNYGAPQNYPPPQNYPSQQNYRTHQNYSPQPNYPPQQNYPPRENYPAQPNYPSQQNFGSPGQGERGGHMPMNNRDYAPSGRDSYQADRRGPMPSYLGNYNQGGQGNYYPPQGDLQGWGQRSDAGTTYGQGTSSGYGESHPAQGEGERFSQVEQGNEQGRRRN